MATEHTVINDDDGPPPLEDMSATLMESAMRSSGSRSTSTVRSAVVTGSSAAVTATEDDGPLLVDDTNRAISDAKIRSASSSAPRQTSGISERAAGRPAAAAASARPARTEEGTTTSFGGLRGGFLSGPPARGSSNQKTSTRAAQPATVGATRASGSREGDDGVLRAKGASQDPLQLKEVQEAVFGKFESQEKLTASLMDGMSSEPELLAALQKPHVARAVAELAADPAGAAKKYAADRELAAVFASFMRVASRTAPKRGDAPSGGSGTGNAPGKTKPKPDEPESQRPAGGQEPPSRGREVNPEQLRGWLSDPRIRAVLNDPFTSAALSQIQADPASFGRFSADPRIQALVRAGILQVPGA